MSHSGRSTPITVDERLARWPDLATQRTWAGILLGNGASCAIWDRFRYISLYEMAASSEIESPLSSADQTLFDAFETKNFERILAALQTTELVCTTLGKDAEWIAERYDSIRTALIDAVRAVHVPSEHVPPQTLHRIRSALLEYDFVYSTNYDLLIY